MPIFELDGRRPEIDPSAWIAPTATIIGDVRIGPDASIWYAAVLRGDVGPIRIGRGTNVQDGSVLHVKTGDVLEIGPDSTVAHGCVIHGRRIGAGSLVGNGATMLDESVVGDGSMLAAGSLLPPGAEVPDHSLAVGAPARVRTEITPGSNAAAILETNAAYYRELMAHHRDGLKRLD